MNFKQLGHYAKVQGGYAYKSKDFADAGIPVIKIKNVGKGSLKYNDVSYVDESFIDTTSNFITNEGDVLISMTGSNLNQPASMVGRVARVSKDDPLSLINQRVGRIVLKEQDEIDLRFLYYYLSQYEVQYYLVSSATGSANQVNINGKLIESINVPDYDYETTKKIAHILSTLDDKIELNLKMNQTLEEMAQALFKSWFVDFDPVHAKANASSDADYDRIAKELGINREVLDLFPDEFEDSEFGMIPKGWNISKINEKLDVLLGGTPSRSNDSYWKDGSVSWINSGKVNEFRVIEPSEMITDQAVRDSSTKLLPKKTTLLAITGATLGQVSLLEIDSCANQSVIGLPESADLNHSFVYPCVCQIITDLISHQTGGAQQHINKGNVENYKIVIPSKDILSRYTDIVEPFMRSISNNVFEQQTLQKTRDTLLPKLLSGELDVSELELDNVTH